MTKTTTDREFRADADRRVGVNSHSKASLRATRPCKTAARRAARRVARQYLTTDAILTIDSVLADAIAHPDDLATPWLVYADWLEDRGHDRRAALLRAVVAFSQAKEALQVVEQERSALYERSQAQLEDWSAAAAAAHQTIVQALCDAALRVEAAGSACRAAYDARDAAQAALSQADRQWATEIYRASLQECQQHADYLERREWGVYHLCHLIGYRPSIGLPT